MVTLTSPITAQNIVDRFEELVTDVADTNIVWGTDSLPGHSAFTSSDFGGVVDKTNSHAINLDYAYPTKYRNLSNLKICYTFYFV